MSYSEELQKVKNQRRKAFAWGFGLVVAVPTIIMFIYCTMIAAPIYTSNSKFTLTVEGAGEIASGLEGGIGSLLMGTGGGSNAAEAYVVKEYITSQDMLENLQKKIDIHKIYNDEKADFWTSPPENPTIEELLKYYNKMIKVRFDDKGGMLVLDVDAFSPTDASRLANVIFQEAEKFVNARSDRIQRDSVKFAEDFLKESEEKVLEANLVLSKFRNKTGDFSPSTTAQGVLEISARLEGELVKTKTEMATLSNFLKPDNSRIKALEAKAKSLQSQIQSQSNRLASSQGSTLADTAQEYEARKLLSEFSIKRYGMALTGYEKARSVARKQKKYFVRVVGPTVPQESLKPDMLYQVSGTFFISLIAYVLGGLMISALRDHIRT
jgi:capsular polysaccharide transport system permease protein